MKASLRHSHALWADISTMSMRCHHRGAFGSPAQRSERSLLPIKSFRGSRRSQSVQVKASPTQARDFQGPDALLFDCDGVLVDTEAEGHRIAFNQAFKDKGMPSKFMPLH